MISLNEERPMKTITLALTMLLMLAGSQSFAATYDFCSVKITHSDPFTYIVVSCDGKILRGETIKSNKAASTFTSEVSKLLKSQPQLSIVSSGYTATSNSSDALFCLLPAKK